MLPAGLGSRGGARANRHLAPLIERAIQAQKKGAGETAQRLCREVLELSPGQLDCLWLLSRIQLKDGKAAAAKALVRRMVALNPNGGVATLDLAMRLLQRGALAEAKLYARNAVRLQPQNAQAHTLLAVILAEFHRPRIAEFIIAGRSTCRANAIRSCSPIWRGA